MDRPDAQSAHARATDYDVVVVGAGIGGIYAVKKLRDIGLTVLGIEGAGGFGGVWYHNRYPGARVDLDSVDYSYYFDESLYLNWTWSERFAAQPELLRYLNHVADRFDIRRHFRFQTWVVGAKWQQDAQRYLVTTDTGDAVRARFLVMATGNLSRSRDLQMPGLSTFRGQWAQTSHWPQSEVPIDGRRVGVVGTGSSGVQTITAIAPRVEELYVFQRTPNFSIQAVNGPVDEVLWKQICADVAGQRTHLFTCGAASHAQRGDKPLEDYSARQQAEIMERQWGAGGHEFAIMFTDQGVSRATNDVVAEFVRAKIRATVADPDVAEALCPYDHPIGTRRLILDTGYYETYNLPHVHLVNLRAEPLQEITPGGIRTDAGEYELDLIIFATGFKPFVGCIDDAGIENAEGLGPTDTWGRGPRTFLGLMTEGFPNFFFLTGPGSPSVLANMTLGNEFHVDWIADLIDHMRATDARTVQPTAAAVDEWTAHVAEVSKDILRRQVDNYMVHVNDDGSRVFMPYIGGFGEFASRAAAVADAGYPGLTFG